MTSIQSTTPAPFRLLVLGGAGFYGASVVQALQKLPEVQVSIAGRSISPGPLQHRFDLMQPSDYALLHDFDLIVNCSDSVGAPPIQAIRYCLDHGIDFFDVGADLASVEQSLSLQTESATGRVVLGVGIFPGLSTALGHFVTKRVDVCETLTLGVRLSPLSGAGKANCALMVHMLELPSVRFENAQRHEGPPVGPSITLPYANKQHLQPSVLIGLPDTALLAKDTEVATIASYMALVPGFLRYSFKVITKLLMWFPRPLKRLMRWSLLQQLLLMRALFLRRVSSSVQLTAVANRGLPTESVAMLHFDDGQQGTALGVAAAVACWRTQPQPPPGLYTAGGLFSLGTLLEEFNKLNDTPLKLELQ